MYLITSGALSFVVIYSFRQTHSLEQPLLVVICLFFLYFQPFIPLTVQDVCLLQTNLGANKQEILLLQKHTHMVDHLEILIYNVLAVQNYL